MRKNAGKCGICGLSKVDGVSFLFRIKSHDFCNLCLKSVGLPIGDVWSGIFYIANNWIDNLDVEAIKNLTIIRLSVGEE